jgi:hypothetical protein
MTNHYLERQPMSHITPTEELKLIEGIVTGHPNGIGISAIEAELKRRKRPTAPYLILG